MSGIGNINPIKNMVEKFLFRIHFCFLYVLLYSVFRNLNWTVEVDARTADFIEKLGIAFFIWFILVNIFLYSRGLKIKWGRSDYLSTTVIVVSIAIVVFLECFLF